MADVGRIASCAACASFFSLYVFGDSGKYCVAVFLPDVFADFGQGFWSHAVESVRM